MFQIPWDGALSSLAVLARCGGLALTAPVIGDTRVPTRLKIGLAFVLTLILMPLAPASAPGANPLAVMVMELFVGMLIGFAGRFVLDAAVYAGGIASFPAGMAIAKQLDPVTQVHIPILGAFYRLLGALAYLAIGGHRTLLAGLAKSYEVVPPGGVTFADGWLEPVVSMTGRVIVIGFRIAAPIFISGLLVNLCLMLIARAVPQMHILIVGAPIKLGVGLLAVAFSLHVIVALTEEALDGSMSDLSTLLHALAG
jgi:flagellar biosynthetic protein FliR